VLRVENLVKTFDGEQTPAPSEEGYRHEPGCSRVNDISFDVREGEMFTLLGPSGCGKTTTLPLHRRTRAPRLR